MNTEPTRERDEARTRSYRDVGGTTGGLGEFMVGLLLLAGGGYLLLNQVEVTGSLGALFGLRHSFGLTLIPIFLGVALLFFNGRSIAGWLLTGLGAVAIFAGILNDLQIFFRPTTLFNTLLMLGLLAAGLGLVFRALRPHVAT